MKYFALLLALIATPLFAANEVLVMRPGYTGQTMYMLVFDETGQAWNGSAFATITSTQADFDVAMTEVSGTGLFRGSIPGTSGQRTVIAYLQAGGSPASTDQAVQLDSGYFDTTNGWKKSLPNVGTVATLTGHTPQTGDAYPVVTSGTHGNAALKTLVDAKASQTSVDAISSANTVTADRVPRQNTFSLGSEGNVARNIVTINAWSTGTRTLGFDFSEILKQTNSAIDTVSSVTVVQADGSPSITTSNLRKHQGGDIAIWDTAAISSANAGTYVVTVTITTLDSNTIVVTGTLEVD